MEIRERLGYTQTNPETKEIPNTYSNLLVRVLIESPFS